MKLSSPFPSLRGLALAAGTLAICLALPADAVRADVVKTKDGKTIEGRITYEGSDFIRVEVAVSASIKESKTIPRAEILELTKAAPDLVAIEALRKQIPAPSLLTAETYRTMIETGPGAFLTQFPASQFRAEAEKIKGELAAELDKVERGYIKIDGDWISPQDRQQFSTLTDSRIRQVAMKRNLAQVNLLGALRDFEILEEQYYGTPAFAAAVNDAKQALPALGQRLQRALGDVEFRNKKWEEEKGLLDELERARVEAARAQEIANFQKAVEQEKTSGIKWLSINENDAKSLGETITIIRAEIDRLNAMNVGALTELGNQLVAADKLIAEGKLAEAREAIKVASGGSPGPGGSKTTGSKSTFASKSPRGPAAKTSYLIALNTKISDAEKAAVEAKKEAEKVAKGETAANAIKKSAEAVLPGVGKPEGTAEAAPAEGAAPEAGKGAEPAAGDQASALTGLMAATGAGAKKPAASATEPVKKASTKKTTPKKKTASEEEEDEEEGKSSKKSARPTTAVADGGGGFRLSFMHMVWIGTGLLVLAVVLLKVTGVGSGKA